MATLFPTPRGARDSGTGEGGTGMRCVPAVCLVEIISISADLDTVKVESPMGRGAVPPTLSSPSPIPIAVTVGILTFFASCVLYGVAVAKAGWS